MDKTTLKERIKNLIPDNTMKECVLIQLMYGQIDMEVAGILLGTKKEEIEKMVQDRIIEELHKKWCPELYWTRHMRNFLREKNDNE